METKEAAPGYDFSAFLNYDSSHDFSLYEIGTYECPPLYSYGTLIRSRSIFHYIRSGSGRLILEDKEYKVSSHQGFLIPNGTKAFYEADEKDPWSYEWLHVGGPRFNEALYQAGLDVNNPIFTPTDDSNTFEECFQSIVDNKEHEFFCIGKLNELCDYLISNSSNKVSSQRNIQLEYVKKTIKYIQVKYSEPIHVNDIATACGLNRSYLTRLFKEATGYSVQGYLIFYRMKMAMKLMQNPSLSIQYISFAVGYNDIFTFSKAFKAQTGVSPSTYRHNLQNNS
jgi:AraC family transcriptional regulator of arabinose operon